MVVIHILVVEMVAVQLVVHHILAYVAERQLVVASVAVEQMAYHILASMAEKRLLLYHILASSAELQMVLDQQKPENHSLWFEMIEALDHIQMSVLVSETSSETLTHNLT